MKFALDLRTLLLVLVLSIAGALPFTSTAPESREFYLFDVTLTSSAPGMIQLFWNLGSGMKESESSAQPLKVEPKPVVYRFMVPTGKLLDFRLRPIDRPGTLTLSKPRVVDRSGHVMRTFSVAEFVPNSNQIQSTHLQGETLTVEMTSDATEPALDLPLKEPLELRLTPLGRLRHGLPAALAIFAAGFLLSMPRFVQAVSRTLDPLRRWLSQHPVRALLLISVGVLMVQAHPVIFFGRSYVSPNNGSLMLYSSQPTLPGATQSEYSDTMGSDIGAMLFVNLYYPMLEHKAFFEHHELPLWNRDNLCGVPLLGQGQSMLGDPFNALTILANGAAWAWDIRFLITRLSLIFGCSFAVWLLTRDLRASSLTAVACGFLGYYSFRINHMANFSLGYSPWIVVAWIGLTRSDTRRKLALWLPTLAAANWIEFSSGTAKEASMLMACLNLAGILLLLFSPARNKVRILLSVALTGVCFILLSAPLWLSFFDALRHSTNAYVIPLVQSYSLPQFIGFFDEIFSRQNHPTHDVWAPSTNALVLLGILGLLVNARKTLKPSAALPLFLAAIVPFVFAFGVVPNAWVLKTPFLANIYHTGNTFSCPLIILVAILGGLGFSALREPVTQPVRWLQFSGAIVGVAALALVFFHVTQDKPPTLFLEGYGLSLAGTLFVIGLGWLQNRSAKPSTSIVATLVIGIPLLLWRHSQYLHVPFVHYSFEPGERADFHARSPAVDALTAPHTTPGRLAAFENNVFPDYHSAIGWESLCGLDPLHGVEFHELASAFGLDRVWKWEFSTPESDASRLQLGHDLFNVTTFVSNRVKGPHTLAGARLVLQADLDLFENPTAWPRAFFTNRLAEYRTAGTFAARARQSDGRPFAAVQVGETKIPSFPRSLEGRIAQSATDYRITTNTTSFTIDAASRGIAVLTETYFPYDFRVTVDGKEVPYFRVNHAFKGVTIEQPGRHVVTFTYWPQHFTLSLWLCAAGVLVSAGGIVWLRRSQSLELTSTT